MIGDARAAGKRRSTTAPGPEFKKKNSRGQSFKHIDRPVGYSGSDREVDGPAARATKGQRAGVGSRDRQNPKEQRARKIEAWCEGHSQSYK